jgi:hypothetical protein
MGVQLPETRSARSGTSASPTRSSVRGPFDVVGVPGFVSNVEVAWN